MPIGPPSLCSMLLRGREDGESWESGRAFWLDFPVNSLLGVDSRLKQWFSTGGAFSSPTHPGQLVMCGTFLVVTAKKGGVIGIYWVEARDNAKHPAVHKTVSQ